MHRLYDLGDRRLKEIAASGVHRIVFSIDYRFVDNAPGTNWAGNLRFSRDDRVKSVNENVRWLQKMLLGLGDQLPAGMLHGCGRRSGLCRNVSKTQRSPVVTGLAS